jgi:hypothetical protein
MKKIALVFLVVLGLLAVPTTGSAAAQETPRYEAIVGDSLIAYSQSWYEHSLANPNPNLSIWAKPGASYGDEDPWIEYLNPTPTVLYLAIGANNVNPLFGADGWTLADIQDHIHMIYDARRAPGVIPCIVLVTIAPAPSAPTLFHQHAGRANLYLRDKAKSSSVYRLADWSVLSRNRADWFSDQLVHLTPAGDRAYFDLLKSVGATC